MGKYTIKLDERPKGQFPISIATSLALEGLFGIHPDIPAPKTPHWMSYDTLYVNVRTLFRNLHSLFSAEDNESMQIEDYTPFILEEMNLIESIVKQHSENRMSVRYYACSYENLKGLYPYAKFKDATTIKQKFYSAKETGTIKACFDKLGGKKQSKLEIFDTTIIANHTNVLLLSNYAIDLLHVKPVRDLALLESHTGAIKKKKEWYTKLNGGKQLGRIPFDKMTVQCFGDSAGVFKPYPQSHRGKLLELSVKYHWSQVTGKDRILQCITSAREPHFEADIRKLY
jgi:hypothetical protein